MSELRNSIQPLIDGYAAAVHARDADAFMRLYDPAVRVFDAWGVWSYEGAAAWRGTVEQWFGSLGDERVRVDMDEVQVQGGPELAMLSAIVTYAGISAAGERLREMQNRLSWVLRRGADGWTIVHEHTSAPLGFDDGKAILQREA